METGRCVWLTGRRGAGKTTVGALVAAELRRRGRAAELLDEDEVDAALGPAPAPVDRARSTGRLRYLADLLVRNGVIAVVASTAPTRAERDELRDALPGFVEVYVDAPPHLAGSRGPETSDDYEEPLAAEVRVVTHDRMPAASAAQVISWLEHVGVVA